MLMSTLSAHRIMAEVLTGNSFPPPQVNGQPPRILVKTLILTTGGGSFLGCVGTFLSSLGTLFSTQPLPE